MELKRRKKKKEHGGDEIQPTKEETAVAKHLRWSCPTKTSTMMGNKVEYFVASKAVECLLDSNWASGKKNTEILFTNRESAVDYLDRLLALGFFSRVVKIKKVKSKDKGKDKDKADEDDSKKKKKEKKTDKMDDSSKDDNAQGQEQLDKDTEKSGTTGTTSTEEGKKKRKVKVKLELHDDQIFFDGDDAYVWIYDPVHPKTLFMGILVVIGSIAICLFPLWPDSFREGVWYVSVFAAVAISIILFLAVFRYILFAIVWGVTGGRHHFWLLPNLTEECGFFESFQPLYTHELKTNSTTNSKPTQEIPIEDRDDLMDDDDDNQRNDDKDTGSEDKDKEPWINLTEEEVEKAKKEAKMDEYQVKPEELDGNSETADDRNTTTTTDPVC